MPKVSTHTHTHVQSYSKAEEVWRDQRRDMGGGKGALPSCQVGCCLAMLPSQRLLPCTLCPKLYATLFVGTASPHTWLCVCVSVCVCVCECVYTCVSVFDFGLVFLVNFLAVLGYIFGFSPLMAVGWDLLPISPPPILNPPVGPRPFTCKRRLLKSHHTNTTVHTCTPHTQPRTLTHSHTLTDSHLVSLWCFLVPETETS